MLQEVTPDIITLFEEQSPEYVRFAPQSCRTQQAWAQSCLPAGWRGHAHDHQPAAGEPAGGDCLDVLSWSHSAALRRSAAQEFFNVSISASRKEDLAQLCYSVLMSGYLFRNCQQRLELQAQLCEGTRPCTAGADPPSKCIHRKSRKYWTFKRQQLPWRLVSWDLAAHSCMLQRGMHWRWRCSPPAAGVLPSCCKQSS